jgi:hypothetical protein
MRFDNKAGFGSTQQSFLQRGTGKTEYVTADQWLDRYADWCESYQARISSSACKLRRESELSEFCTGCKGTLNKNGKNNQK